MKKIIHHDNEFLYKQLGAGLPDALLIAKRYLDHMYSLHWRGLEEKVARLEQEPTDTMMKNTNNKLEQEPTDTSYSRKLEEELSKLQHENRRLEKRIILLELTIENLEAEVERLRNILSNFNLYSYINNP